MWQVVINQPSRVAVRDYSGTDTAFQKTSNIKPTDYEDFMLYALFWVSVCELTESVNVECSFVFVAQVTHHHHQVEEDWWLDGLKGAVLKDDIVHEHDGFRQQINDMETYLISCLPAGTKWGPYNDVVHAASSETFEPQRLEKIIEALVAVFVKHVSAPFARGSVQCNIQFTVAIYHSSVMNPDIYKPPRSALSLVTMKWRPSITD